MIKSLKADDPQKNGNNDTNSNYIENVRNRITDTILGMCFKLYVKQVGAFNAVVNESETHRIVIVDNMFVRV